MQRRITKVKVHKGRVQIKYLRRKRKDDDDPDEYSLACRDLPHPDLEKALADLAPAVREWLEVSPTTFPRLTPISVAYTWRLDTEDREVMGASVCALVELSMSNAPLILNCPHKPERPYNADAPDEQHDVCLPAETVAALRTVMQEAEAYVDGKRTQGTLDFEPRPSAETVGAGP